MWFTDPVKELHSFIIFLHLTITFLFYCDSRQFEILICAQYILSFIAPCLLEMFLLDIWHLFK